MQIPERDLQRQICDYLNAALGPPAWWTMFPAGGPRKSWQSVQGLKPGVPDFLIIWKGCAIWIEAKTANGRMTPKQCKCQMDLRVAGAVVDVIRSIDELVRLLEVLGLPLRAALV